MEESDTISSDSQRIITVIRVRPVSSGENQLNLRPIVNHDDENIDAGLRILDPVFYTLGMPS
jgi:hypothetical protein